MEKQRRSLFNIIEKIDDMNQLTQFNNCLLIATTDLIKFYMIISPQQHVFSAFFAAIFDSPISMNILHTLTFILCKIMRMHVITCACANVGDLWLFTIHLCSFLCVRSYHLHHHHHIEKLHLYLASKELLVYSSHSIRKIALFHWYIN